MSEFFRRTGVKTAGAILCILSLTAGLVSGLLVLLMLSAGVYDSSGSLYEPFVEQTMARNASSIMDGYFDPDDPTHPWVSYHSGGIYTGEGSNLVYTITDSSTEKTVLATYDGKEDVFYSDEYHYSYETAELVSTEDAYTLTGQVFSCDGSYYGYSEDAEMFLPLEDITAQYIVACEELPGNVKDLGFTYQDEHYEFDGDLFYRAEQNQAYRVDYTTYVITCYLRRNLPYQDIYRNIYYLSVDIEVLRFWLIAITAAALILGGVLLVVLGRSVGHVNGKDELTINPIYRIPPDAALLLCVLAGSLCLELTVGIGEGDYLTATLAFDLVMLLGLVTAAVYAVMTLCIRGKTHTLVSASLIGWCVRNLGRLVRWLGRWCRKGLNCLPLIWKVMVCYGLLCLLELFGLELLTWGGGVLYLLWFLEKLALGFLVAYVALAFRRLKQGAEAIAAGDYNAKVDDTRLVMDFRDTANTLNHIQDGMSAAVDSRMKSERLKTELITNVSHDLKTPLTSIVSYVDLLKQEPAGSEAAAEYLEVLDRQSARLKKLVEDLVEASKASTGNITVQKAPLDFTMLLGQALGEYNQRLVAAGLTPVLHVPEGPVMIQADGRLLWRVFDNLLGNIVKYAMPGTRVYLSVDTGDRVTATFRNISRDPLDVSPDELMERFVRGDASRHTEGSGLGLSIARSLTDSMGGTFSLSVDGDLFKAMVTFPILTDVLTPETAAEAEPPLR